jgi:capsular polysaccharide biosynthesis protein
VRRVVNEADVLEVLGEANFIAVEPESLSVAGQIELFASARMVVGPHGAGFSNGIFSPRLEALEFFQDRHVNISTTAALVAAGHTHWSLMCPRVPSVRRRRNQDLRVPLPLLRKTLEAMGAIS